MLICLPLNKIYAMNNIKDHYFKISLIIFMIWIGFCTYNLSQNERYKIYNNEYHFFKIDTQTGKTLKYDFEAKKFIKIKE